MTTIYTVNNKVLKNRVNDKWLIKAPTGPIFDEVTIGTQTWLAKNLTIDDGGEGIIIKDNVTANGLNMGTQYYYTYDAAVRVVNTIDGWHLPSKSEVETLLRNMGYTIDGYQEGSGTELKSTSGWTSSTYGGNGTDIYGFTALPVGIITNNTLTGSGNYTQFWEIPNSGSIAPVILLNYSDSYTLYNGANSTVNYCAVRLVKDVV